MVTIEDCLALSELTEEEADLIARHEGVPEMVGVELGNFLLRTARGRRRIRHWIHDEIRRAQAAGDQLQVVRLKVVLQHFLECHPD